MRNLEGFHFFCLHTESFVCYHFSSYHQHLRKSNLLHSCLATPSAEITGSE